jgi:hypothetical protein
MGATWRPDLLDYADDQNHAELLRWARSGKLGVAIAESRRLERLTALAHYRLRRTGSPAAAV